MLPMGECIEAMADAFRALARGAAVQPLRQVVRLPDSPNVLATMPAQVGTLHGDRKGAALGAKVITVFPGNDATPYDSHMGVVLLFDNEVGRLLSVMDAGSITAIRTAAASGLATRLLARPEAGNLAILGSGVQAMTHLEAMRAVRTLRRVRVWSRTLEHARAFAQKAGARFGLTVEVCETARAAAVAADLICTVTASREPVLQAGWVTPGAHINAVGASLPTTRELDSATVRMARLFTDRRESLLREAGDVLVPLAEGAITEAHVQGELAEILTGAVPGRGSADEVTLFKSLGLAIEDVAAARLIYEKALALGTGIWVSLGGLRQDA